MDGFFIVDKPKGMTSQRLCTTIKKKFNIKHVGHNGTLDPDTTGLMVVATGKATKLLKLINEHDKTYIATITFGLLTNTLDISGNILDEKKMEFSLNELKEKIAFVAAYKEQIPPMVSAIKVNGKKLYELERKNISVELKKRPTFVKNYEILSDLRMVDNHLEFDILLDTTKGFYVRSFARDLGEALNGYGCLKNLRRIKAGDFSIENSTPLQLLDYSNFKQITDIFNDFLTVEVNDYIKNLVLNGVVLDERQIKTDKCFYVTNKSAIIAIYEPYEEYKYKPIIVFKE